MTATDWKSMLSFIWKMAAGDFYEPEGPKPEWFMAGISAAMLAPTAVNQQKLRFVLHDGNKVSAKIFFRFGAIPESTLA